MKKEDGKTPLDITTLCHLPWVFIGKLLFYGIGIPVRGLYAGWVIARDNADRPKVTS